MQPAIPHAVQDQMLSDTILVLAAALFSGAPVFGLCFWIVRRWKLRSIRVFLFSGAAGLALAAFFMYEFGNTGVPFAFCALVGGFFGARYAGELNRRRSRKRR